MNARGRGRNQRAAPRRQTVDQRFRNLERRLTGHKTVPATNPPAFVQLPWNSWTFERTDITTSVLEGFNVTVADVIGQLKSRLAISDGADLRIKVQSAQTWVTASGLILPDLEATFYELAGEATATDQNPRSTQRDIGTLNMPARCGYMYPSADRREIVNSSKGALIISNGIATETGSKITFRIQVLWQSSA